MRDTTLAIVVAIIVVIKSHLLCPRQRSASSSEKECQTVILPRVIEKSSCDPAFYLNVLSKSHLTRPPAFVLIGLVPSAA